MKRILMSLLCIAFLVGGVIGCATTNPCAPLIDTPVVLETVAVHQEAFFVKAHDTDGDGVADVMAVYLKKRYSNELVEYFNRPLTEDEVAKVNIMIEKKKAREKVNSQ